MKTGMHRQNVPLSLIIAAFMALMAVLLYSFHNQKAKETSPTGGRVTREELIKSSHDQELQKFDLTGFDEMGKKFWNLQGDAAKIEPGQTIYLDQNVTLKLRDATTIKTDHVQWSQDGGTLKTDSLVTVDHENAKVTGMGALGKPNESFIQLNRKIEMTVNQTTKVNCKGPLKIFYKENKMVFYRDVKITDEKGTVTAHRMDVFFDSEQKKIKQIVAVGDVVIQRGTDTTHSQRAIYTVATGSIRLEGNPEITLHKESTKLLNGTLRN